MGLASPPISARLHRSRPGAVGNIARRRKLARLPASGCLHANSENSATTSHNSSFKIRWLTRPAGHAGCQAVSSEYVAPPALPVISAQFGVPAASPHHVLALLHSWFALGQAFLWPNGRQPGRKPVILGDIDICRGGGGRAGAEYRSAIVMRFFHYSRRLRQVVINALMRRLPEGRVSRMMSFVMLVTTTAAGRPPAGGVVLAGSAGMRFSDPRDCRAGPVMIFVFIDETLPVERRQEVPRSHHAWQLCSLFRHKRVLSYMLASGFSFLPECSRS